MNACKSNSDCLEPLAVPGEYSYSRAMDAPPLYTAAEVAAALRVTPRKVHRWAREGHLNVIWLPGKRGNLRMTEEELHRLLGLQERGSAA